MVSERRFLEARWHELVMLNYVVDPAVLADRIPAGCELDTWSGHAFVSVVGFQFLGTRVLGFPIPFHRNFEEVNLRYYVRRRVNGVWRRGVAFVKELVPRYAAAIIARTVYGENYEALPMRHSSGVVGNRRTARYEWRRNGAWEGVGAAFAGPPVPLSDEAEETFISEHYWGYSSRRDRTTVEYRVEHPRWQVWRAETSSLECDVATLYGSEFVEALSAAPSSAFAADGSPVSVMRGRRLRPVPAA